MLQLLDVLVREREMAVLFVSHDLAVVAQVTDRALVMKDGRAMEEGPVLDVIGAPRAEYTRTLVAGARKLERALDLRSPR
ncbi:hypothetical protein [Streptomyces sp. NPDC002962]|uniref:hypothetical protein n=1 Tax=Streptomyces sp. NPDC002962 TaxID=3364674 RepID=UPI00369F94A2